MNVIATPTASLLKGANCSKTQPALSPSLPGVSSSFLQALENSTSDPVSQTDFHGQIQSTLPTWASAVLQLEGASLTPSKQRDDSENDNPLASVADAVWLATWFQNHAPALEKVPAAETEIVSSNSFLSSPAPAPSNAPSTVPSTLPRPVTVSDGLNPAGMGATPKPLAMFSSELSSRIDASISDDPKQNPWGPADKPVNALTNAPMATPSRVADGLSLAPTFAFQTSSQSASTGLNLWDQKSPQNATSDSDNWRSTEVFFKAPIVSGGSVKLGQSVGFKGLTDFSNDLSMPVRPGSAQVSLVPHIGQNLTHQTVGTEAVAQSHSPDAQSTSNLADALKQCVERNSPAQMPAPANASGDVSRSFPLPVMVSDRVQPAWMEAPSKPLPMIFSEFSSRIDEPISDDPKKSPWGAPDQPVKALTNAAIATPSRAADGLLPPPTSSIQTSSQPTSLGLNILEKTSPKNLSTDSDNWRSKEVFFKAPMDMGGSVKVGQSVGFKELNDFSNDLSMPVIPGSAQVSLDPHSGPNLAHQAVGTDAVAQSHSPDAQSTSNLADTVKQWVERSLQLAELTFSEAGQDGLQVRVELNGQEATVYFLTDHVQYRDAIESQIDYLSDRLADQGLKLAGSFVGQGSAQNSPHKQSAHSMLSRQHESETASAKVLSMDPVLREMKSVHHGQVLDVFA